jgi:Fic family protein
MAKSVKKYWTSDGGGITRRDRRGCEYAAYIPDALTGRPFSFDGDVAADVADAEADIRRLNAQASSLVSTESVARLLLRAEAVASSKIEGLRIGAGRLLRAEAGWQFDAHGRTDVTAQEVLGNVDAMAAALDAAGGGDVTPETILGIHARLLAGTELSQHAGRVRTVQNWIGGSSFNPCSAVFVPPPPDQVMPLLADLARFCSDDSLPAVAQAAIAHAQFETIHPFVDGNGRTGRALIHLILRRRGLAPKVVPPVSLVLATLSGAYAAALTAYRYEGEPSSPDAAEGMNRWVALFAGCCCRAVSDAAGFESRIRDMQDAWRARLGSVRRDSTVDLLIDLLPGTPIITVTGASALLDRSFNATNSGVEALVAAGILHQVNVGRRNRAFEATEVIAAFTDLERRLGSPDGDTLASLPARPVPARRR